MATATIRIQLTCTVREDKETQCFVSHCPALNVFSAGNTELDAQEAIRSALKLYVLALYNQNRLDEKLLTTGFFPVGDQPALPAASSDEFIAVRVSREDVQQIEVDVPLLLALRHRDTELQTA